MIYTFYQENGWLVDFWFSYDKFVGFYIWPTVLHVLHSLTAHQLIKQALTQQACTKACPNIFPEICGSFQKFSHNMLELE